MSVEAIQQCRENDGDDHFMCGCITSHVRYIMDYWTGTNCTWADDDVTALGILAGHAIRAGLHHDAAIPKSLIAAIDKHTASGMPLREDAPQSAAEAEGRQPDPAKQGDAQ